MSTAKIHNVSIRGHDIAVTVHGSAGMPVMLLPGGAAAVDGFYPGLIEKLAPEHTVIEHDRLGTGTSPVPDEPVSLTSWSDDLITVLDALDLPRVVLIGQSLGGALTAMSLVNHPDRIAGALLLDPTPINDGLICRTMPAYGVIGRLPLIKTWMNNAPKRFKPKGLSPEANRAYDKMIVGDLMADTFRVVGKLGDDHKAFVGRQVTAGAPVDLITADRSPRSRIRRAHEALATQLGGRVELWPDTSHILHLERPDLVVQHALDIVARAQKFVASTG